jgi:hypothetical protein
MDEHHIGPALALCFVQTGLDDSGQFSATFFLACLAAMELEGVALDEI